MLRWYLISTGILNGYPGVLAIQRVTGTRIFFQVQGQRGNLFNCGSLYMHVCMKNPSKYLKK